MNIFLGIIVLDQKQYYWITDPQKKFKPIFIFPEDLNTALNGYMLFIFLSLIVNR